MRTINIEPNWQAMFDFAVAIVKKEIPKKQGKETVGEMLKFGKRLHASQESKARFEVASSFEGKASK